MIYHVRKDRHHYTPNRLALWRIPRRKNKAVLQADVKFSPDTIAPPEDHPRNERLQINKLVGFAWLWRARNRHSVRIGWRISLLDPEMVEWFLYVRDKGDLYWLRCGETVKTEVTELRLEISKQHTAELSVSQRVGGNLREFGINDKFKFPQYVGYMSEPYYGGRRAAAPQDMALMLNQTLFYE